MNYDLSGSKSYEQIVAEQIQKQKEENERRKKIEEEIKQNEIERNEKYKELVKIKVFGIIGNEYMNKKLGDELEKYSTLFGIKIDQKLKRNENKVIDRIEHRKKYADNLGNYFLNLSEEYIIKYFNERNVDEESFQNFLIYADDTIIINLIVKNNFYTLLPEKYKNLMKENCSEYVFDSLKQENISFKNTPEHQEWRDKFDRKEEILNKKTNNTGVYTSDKNTSEHQKWREIFSKNNIAS